MSVERRVLVTPQELKEGAVSLSAQAAKHLSVLRLAPGDDVELFDGAGRYCKGTLTGPNVVDAGPPQAAPPVDPATSLTLLFAVPKGDGSDVVIRACTELGVAVFAPILTDRTVARPKGRRAERWQRIAAEAARQSGRYWVPRVREAVGLSGALEALPKSTCIRLLAWVPESDRTLSATLLEARAATDENVGVALLIGPEGGLSDKEAKLARGNRFQTVSLGPRVLRAATASITATALVLHHLGDLDL